MKLQERASAVGSSSSSSSSSEDDLDGKVDLPYLLIIFLDCQSWFQKFQKALESAASAMIYPQSRRSMTSSQPRRRIWDPLLLLSLLFFVVTPGSVHAYDDSFQLLHAAPTPPSSPPIAKEYSSYYFETTARMILQEVNTIVVNVFRQSIHGAVPACAYDVQLCG